MAWDSVPWFVGGGAEHSPEVARLLSYAAFGGSEGIIGSGDLRVEEQEVPDGTVQVLPGACSVLNRASAQEYQAYAGRLPTADTVSISSTDSSGGRSDLIVARVEDPHLSGEPWANPADPKTGPYIFTRVIPNVDPSTTSLQEVNPGESGIALARIDVPASTGTITQAMVTDLRSMAQQRRERRQTVGSPGAQESLSSSTYVTFPSSGSWSVEVPSWATHAILRADATGVRFNAAISGDFRVSLGTESGTICPFDVAPSGGAKDRGNFTAVAEIEVPAALRGTTQTFAMEGRRSGGDANSTLDSGGWINTIQDVEFVERPD